MPSSDTGWWIGTGAALLVTHSALAALASRFTPGREPEPAAILGLVLLLAAAGALYLARVTRIRDGATGGGLLGWVFAVGLVLRLSLLAPPAILEDDYQRYLWDGAVAARGMNPYAVAPAEVLARDERVPPALLVLARESPGTIAAVNHPSLRSIYPPVAQAAFAFAHRLAPWSLPGWRALLLAADLATLALLALLLRALGLSPLGLAVYWWNPVLIKETYNSAHMDVLVLPLVLGAVLLALRGRHLGAATALGLAAGAKLWPVLLAPVLLRPAVRTPKRLLRSLAVLGALTAAALVPLSAGLAETSGILSYSRRWEINDGAFMLLVWGARIAGFSREGAALAARVGFLGLLGAWIVRLSRRESDGALDLVERCLWILAALFLLGPTQFPWYYVWMLPFLALSPKVSLLALTPLLSLYYMRFYFESRSATGIFDHGIVWLEYLPVGYLLAREWRRGRELQPAPATG